MPTKIEAYLVEGQIFLTLEEAEKYESRQLEKNKERTLYEERRIEVYIS